MFIATSEPNKQHRPSEDADDNAEGVLKPPAQGCARQRTTLGDR